MFEKQVSQVCRLTWVSTVYCLSRADTRTGRMISLSTSLAAKREKGGIPALHVHEGDSAFFSLVCVREHRKDTPHEHVSSSQQP